MINATLCIYNLQNKLLIYQYKEYMHIFMYARSFGSKHKQIVEELYSKNKICNLNINLNK